MVSLDGEPHKLLTVVAVGSGLIVAIVVLLVLIAFIDCRKPAALRNATNSGWQLQQKHQQHQHKQHQSIDERLRFKQHRSKSMFSLFSKRASLDITIVDVNYLERIGVARAPLDRQVSVERFTSANNSASTSTMSTKTTTDSSCSIVVDEVAAPVRQSHRMQRCAEDDAGTKMFGGSTGKLYGISTVSC